MKTAVLTLDLQAGIIGLYPAAEQVIAPASKITDHARANGWLLVHVGLGFDEGHPEIPDFESPFLTIKQKGLFVKGSPSAAFHPSVARPDDLIVYKQRIGAFSQNHLSLLLRARGIEHLVYFGIATSGIVLSTVRQAFDLDFRSTVIKDACFDHDPEVHSVLTEKIFPRQAQVLTADEFLVTRR